MSVHRTQGAPASMQLPLQLQVLCFCPPENSWGNRTLQSSSFSPTCTNNSICFVFASSFPFASPWTKERFSNYSSQLACIHSVNHLDLETPFAFAFVNVRFLSSDLVNTAPNLVPSKIMLGQNGKGYASCITARATVSIFLNHFRLQSPSVTPTFNFQ